MKKAYVAAVVLAFAFAIAMAGAATAEHHMKMGEGCKYCGMSLEKFASSAMKITYDDGTMVQTCSIHCAAIDMALNIDKAPTEILVGDYDTKEKINAEEAVWVLDKKNPGVMTARAKWAFRDKDGAKAYIKENSGKKVSFEKAIEAAYEDMYKDTKMIREKRKMMREKKGGMKH
jgi:nitrous oxide reductase accessory protein NosL